MRTFLILTVFLCSINSFAQKKAASFIRDRPMPARAINDFGKVLEKDDKDHLEGHSEAFREKTGNNIVLIILPSLPNKTGSTVDVSQLANLYFNKWNMGDSGVVILTIRKPLSIAIRMGKRFDTLMTKADLDLILNERIMPSFNKDHVFIGLKDGFYRLESTIEEAPALQAKKEQEAAAMNNNSQQSQPAYSPYKPQQKEMTLGETIEAFITLGLIIFYFVYRKRRRGVLANSIDEGYASDADAWLTRKGTTIRRTVNDH